MKRADFAAELARRRADAGLSLANLASRAHLHRGYAGNVEHGHRWPTETVARALDSALNADGVLLATWEAADRVPRTRDADGRPAELLELAARAEASDVSPATLDLLDTSVDELARAYTRAPPAELLRDVRARARQVGSLLDGRATLAQRRRLLVAAGWIALFAATLYVDLGQRGAPRPPPGPRPDYWAVRPSTTKSARGRAKSTRGLRWWTRTGPGLRSWPRRERPSPHCAVPLRPRWLCSPREQRLA